MDKNKSKNKQNKDYPEMSQTYKCDDTVVLVEPIFKKEGKRTLFHSLGQIVHKENQDA